MRIKNTWTNLMLSLFSEQRRLLARVSMQNHSVRMRGHSRRSSKRSWRTSLHSRACYQKKHLIIIVIAFISMYWTGFLIKKFRFGKKYSLVCKAVLLKKSKLTLSLGFLPSALLVIWRQSSSMTAPFDLLDLKYWRDLRMLYFLAFKLKIDFGIYYFHSCLLLYKLEVIFRDCFLKKSTF